MAGEMPDEGALVIYDDELGYLAGVLAVHLAVQLKTCDKNIDIAFVTSGSVVSPWTVNTLEQARVQQALIEHGVKIYPNLVLEKVTETALEAHCVFSGRSTTLPCHTLLPVTQRRPVTDLYNAVLTINEDADIELIGDACAPGLIADAVYSGHLAARNFESDPEEINAALFRREIPSLIQA